MQAGDDATGLTLAHQPRLCLPAVGKSWKVGRWTVDGGMPPNSPDSYA